ncbi:hypothetical protein IT568_10525 [bacterium]|nr:hypothetical protein [bacterium]
MKSLTSVTIFLICFSQLLAQEKKFGKFSEEVNKEFNNQYLKMDLNRVDGFFMAYQMPENSLPQLKLIQKSFGLKPEHKWDLNFFVGYAFNSAEVKNSQKVRYRVEVTKGFFDKFPIYFGFRKYKITDTKDNWRVGFAENFSTTALLSRDYRDYYKRKGWSIFSKVLINGKMTTEIEYKRDNHKSLEAIDRKISIFRGGKQRYNPSLGPDDIVSSLASRDTPDAKKFEGDYHSLRVGFLWKNWERKREIREGFELSTEIEETIGKKSVRDFGLYTLEGKIYQPLTKKINFNSRIKIGSLTETDLQQKRFELGGISTLRAFGFKEFRGNRMFLWNSELFLHSWLNEQNASYEGWLGKMDFILLYDVGQVWHEKESDNFYQSGNFDFGKLESNVGIALTEKTGDLRFEILRTLSEKNANWEFYLRFAWDF